jgi:hypothetical protein
MHQAIGIGKGKSIDHNRLDQTENCSVNANAKAENEYSGNGEAGGLDKETDGVAHGGLEVIGDS